jgi:membrane protein implicated in regulation of membrane protease activity
MQNVGNVDRIIRIVLGIILLALVFVGPKTPWGWIGLIPLITGLVSFCPLYFITKIKTN